jgi:hypothetical protein
MKLFTANRKDSRSSVHHLLPAFLILALALSSVTPGWATESSTAPGHDGDITVDHLRHWARAWSEDALPVLRKALDDPRETIRIEALVTMRTAPGKAVPPTANWIEAVIDQFGHGSDTVRIHALQTLMHCFGEEARTREFCETLPGTVFPRYLHPWVRSMVRELKKEPSLRLRLDELASATQALVRDHLRTATDTAQAAEIAADWLRRQPDVATVEITRDMLWFTLEEDGGETGILLPSLSAERTPTSP